MLGSARASRAGERAPAVANFSAEPKSVLARAPKRALEARALPRSKKIFRRFVAPRDFKRGSQSAFINRVQSNRRAPSPAPRTFSRRECFRMLAKETRLLLDG